MKKYFYNIITWKQKEPFAPIAKGLLIILSLFYLLAVKIHLTLYGLGLLKRHRLKSPVISVGNITWGGTGKTPLVEAISSHLVSAGNRITILTRGYGKDEDRVLKDTLIGADIYVGRDRLGNARLAEKKKPSLFILDDGFQHLRIRRDIDIVAINATEPFGRGRLLIPAGILREPLGHLRRADMAVLTRSDLVSAERLAGIKEEILRANPKIEIFESVHQAVSFATSAGKALPLEYIRGRRICVLSGIGDNDSFARTVEGLGGRIGLKAHYLDHHMYKREELLKIISDCKTNGIDTVVTTAKDWVKLKDLPGKEPEAEFLILKIALRLKDEKVFFKRISSVLSG